MATHRTSEPLKVCMLIAAFPPVYTGAGKQALLLTRSIMREGVRVFFVTRTPDTPGWRTRDMGDLDVVRVYRRNDILALVRLVITLYVHRHRFDILHMHGVFYYTYVAVLCAKLLGKKTLVKMTMLGGAPQSIDLFLQALALVFGEDLLRFR